MDKEKLIALGKKYLWLTFGRDESFFETEGAILASGEGCYYIDAEGNRYFDAGGGQAALTVGFNHPAIIEAICEQAKKISANPSGWPAPIPAILLAEKIASLSPEGMTKTFFTVTGSDANETAIKIARQYWKMKGKGNKYKTITRWLDYTGSTLAMSAASGFFGPQRTAFEPLPSGFIHINPPYCYRCPYKMTHPDCGIECVNEFRRRVEYEGPDTVACFLGDLIFSTAGTIVSPPEYVKRVRQICDEYEILMIVDEVMTNFGKSGAWFACQIYDIVPDMMTLGKSLSGGYSPIAAVHVKQKIAEAFSGDPSRYFHSGFTFGGNPFSCAVALAHIELIENLGLIAEVPKKHGFIKSELEKLKQSSRIIGDVRGMGLMFSIEMVKDQATKKAFPIEEFSQIAQRESKKLRFNILLGPSTLTIRPPLIASMEDLKVMLDLIAKLISRLEAEFL